MSDARYAAVGGAAALVAAVTALPVSGDAVPQLERDLFTWVNQLPDLPVFLIWVPMQVGNVAAALAVCLALWVTDHRRHAALAAVAGVGAWLIAKAIKAVVERERPAELLGHVELRGDAESGGLGWVSGHAAVTAALVTVMWPLLTRRGRIAVVAAAVPMYLLRVYSGGHLPLDMVSGALVGVALGALLVSVAGTQRAENR